MQGPGLDLPDARGKCGLVHNIRLVVVSFLRRPNFTTPKARVERGSILLGLLSVIWSLSDRDIITLMSYGRSGPSRTRKAIAAREFVRMGDPMDFLKMLLQRCA